MKRLLLFFVWFLLFLPACFSYAQRRPRLAYVPRNVVNLDTLAWEKGMVLEGTFRIKNVGDTTLFVSFVTTTCPCFQIDSITPRLEPGEYGIIRATYHPTSPGSFNQAVVFISNALQEPRRVYLRGYLKKEEDQ